MNTIKNISLSFFLIGGDLLGLGHVYRSLKIANLLISTGIFLPSDISFFLLDRAPNNSSSALNLISSTFPDSNVAQIDSILNCSHTSTFIVLDKLANTFLESYYCSCNSSKLIVLDDRNAAFNLADICFNPLYSRFLYFNQSSCQFFDGFEYQPLFVDYSPSNKIPNNFLSNICIVQGAADPNCVSLDIAEALLSNSQNTNLYITIIKGNANNCSYSSNRFPKNISIVESPDNFYDYLSHSDLVISSVGITAYDLIALNIPALFITSIPHEVETGLRLNNFSLKLFYGINSDENLSTLSSAISQLNLPDFNKSFSDISNLFHALNFNQTFLNFIMENSYD